MRDILILVGIALAAVAVGATIFFFGDGKSLLPQGDVANSAAVAVSAVRVASGQNSSVSDRTNYLVRSPIQFAELWKMTDASGPLPEIDFSKYDILGIFAGDQHTAGYSVNVSEVLDTDTRIVHVVITKPGASCVLAQAVTSPYEIVRVPKSSIPYGHADSFSTASCIK